MGNAELRKRIAQVGIMSRNRIVVLAVLVALAGVASRYGQDTGEDAQQLFQQAQDLVKAQKFDQALDLLKKAIRLAPRNDLYLATASDCELKAGKYADGLEHALQAIRINDKVGPYYILAAGNALLAQDLDRAREYIDLVLKRGDEFGAGPVKDARLLQDALGPKTYTLHWNLDPKKGQVIGGTMAIAMPKTSLPYQTTTYEITGAQSHRLVKGDVNDILYVVPRGTEAIALTTKVTVELHTFKKELAKATSKPLPQEARAYLSASEAINPKSAVLKKVAAEVKAGTPVETARNILAWMKKNVEYKLEGTNIGKLDFESVDEIVERGHAECRGYAILFTALCRAADVPARPVWGLTRVAPGQDQRFGDIASHNWAEFYVSGVGWIPVDPQRPETLGCLPTSCMRIFMDGRKNKGSTETLPMLNLVSMNGDKLKFEESR
jgi:tetratricopeptide (TPR) repeat protein